MFIRLNIKCLESSTSLSSRYIFPSFSLSSLPSIPYLISTFIPSFLSFHSKFSTPSSSVSPPSTRSYIPFYASLTSTLSIPLPLLLLLSPHRFPLFLFHSRLSPFHSRIYAFLSIPCSLHSMPPSLPLSAIRSLYFYPFLLPFFLSLSLFLSFLSPFFSFLYSFIPVFIPFLFSLFPTFS